MSISNRTFGVPKRRPKVLALMAQMAFGTLFLGVFSAAQADDQPVVTLTIHPARIEDSASHQRLLPADPDLKRGNAAVVLLRMPWEQQRWMQEWFPKIRDVSQLPPGNAQVAEFPFDRFAGEMRRAAYLRDADWNYPVDDEPLDEILLPDVQGMRSFVGFGMSIWVNQRIAAADFHGAREGVLVQLACARHVGRAQFVVNQLVAAAIADQGLNSLERVIGTNGSPNLHHAIQLLPAGLGRGIEAVQWNSVIEERSLPNAHGGIPKAGDDASWTRALDHWLERWLSYDEAPSPTKSAAIRSRIVAAAREAFAKEAPPDLDLASASDDETAMRFLLITSRHINEAAESAWRLDEPAALAELVHLDARVNELQPVLGEGLLSYLAHPLRWYLPIHSFGRRARMLEVVEALRDAAARNGGRFPATLAEAPARVPLDPFTGKPFVYEPAADGHSARLATPPIPGVDDPRYGRIYELTIATE